MSVRNLPVFYASVAMLVTAGGLGALLVHDGEVGMDEAKLAYVREGDQVGLKGGLAQFQIPESDTWAFVRNLAFGDTYLLETAVDAMILLTGVPADAPPEAIVHGIVIYSGDHPVAGRLVIVDVHDVDEPYFDWA